jgi:hypothetical protein
MRTACHHQKKHHDTHLPRLTECISTPDQPANPQLPRQSPQIKITSIPHSNRLQSRNTANPSRNSSVQAFPTRPSQKLKHLEETISTELRPRSADPIPRAGIRIRRADRCAKMPSGAFFFKKNAEPDTVLISSFKKEKCRPTSSMSLMLRSKHKITLSGLPVTISCR